MYLHLKALRQSELSAPERCARFILIHLWRRHGDQWLSGPRRSLLPKTGDGHVIEQLESLGFELRARQRLRLQNLASLQELWEHFFFRGVVLDSHEGLLGWMKGVYPLHLRTDIPSPEDMLAIQARGERFASLLLTDEDQFTSHGRHRDACDFLLHDFEHAQKFFSDPESFRGQNTFFRKLKDSQDAFRRWTSDLEFIKAFDYLKADMNSHPVHLLKYLKAIVLAAEIKMTRERCPQLDPFWKSLFGAWSLPAKAQYSALKLNHPDLEQVEDQIAVRDFFNLTQNSLASNAAEAR